MTERQVNIGDVVGRLAGRGKYWRGRVTGFAPNGSARVDIGNGQDRIWAVRSLQIMKEGDNAPRPTPREKAPLLPQTAQRPVPEILPTPSRFTAHPAFRPYLDHCAGSLAYCAGEPLLETETSAWRAGWVASALNVRRALAERMPGGNE